MKSQIYEPLIGLEIHTQLLTKLFCGCSGIPLLEIVGKPEINSPSEEAHDYRSEVS